MPTHPVSNRNKMEFMLRGCFFNFFVFLIFILCEQAFATSSLLLKPQPRCQNFLKEIFGTQIQVLDRQAYEEIEKHPIKALAKQLKERGIQVGFEFDHAQTIGLPKAFLGESIQTKSLIRILNEVFPEARINRPCLPNEVHVFLEVIDSFEYESFSALHNLQGAIEMSLLKSANPFMSTLSKNGIRASYQISAEKKALALYTDEENLANFSYLINHIPQSKKPDLIFLSQSLVRPAEETANQVFKQTKEYGFTTLSEFTSSLPARRPRRLIVYNDQSGKMPDLYAASDYAIVMAPNNIFEPLQQKVPTLFFTSPRVLGEYDRAKFLEMALTAKATTGGVEVANLRQLSAGFKELFKVDPKKILHPAFVIPPGASQNAFQKLLNQLESEVRLALPPAP